MSKKSNKVKFGLKNCHYAKATFDEDGSVTYAKPVRIPGAVSLSMDANGEIEPFYADNIAYYVVNNNSGYEGDLEIALIPESFLTDIMHEELDGNGVLAENANVELEHFAFLFEFDGDQRHIRHVLYNCVASRPSIEGETNEDSKEVKTDTLNLQATPLANGYVKAKTGTNTTDDVYNKWYDAVYEPQAEAVDTEDTSHTEEPQQKLAESLVQKYGDDVVFVNKVVINDMNFEDAYNEAIQQKSIAQQNADKQKIENEAAIAKAEADKQVAITNAEAEAQKTSIAADAQAEANRKLAESLSDTLIDYQKIQKWDGKLPTVSGGNALVSIDPAE